MAATKNKATAFFTGASTGVGELQSDRLTKRGLDLIPVAILVIALVRTFGTVGVVCGVRLDPSRRRSCSDLRLCGHRGRRGVLTCGRRRPDGSRLLQQSTRL